MFNSLDFAKLLLRLILGGLILFHGVHKLIYGISEVEAMLRSINLPEFIAYGVYVGELIAPLFIILGLYARVASVVLAINMLMAIFLAYDFSLSISKYGSLLIETPLLFFVMSILIFLLGSGKYGVNNK